MMVSKYAVFLAVLIGVVSAVKFDMCRTKPPVMKNFDLLKLEGRWYEYARLPNLYQYFNEETCNTQDMTVDGKGIRFTNSFVNRTSGKRASYECTMTANPDKPGKVLVAVPKEGVSDYFSVLDAQYDDYVVFYYCDTLWYFRVELAWVLTRERVLSEEKKGVLIKKLKTLKIDIDRLKYQDPKKCK